MRQNIIGREREMTNLDNYISSNQSEFIAIYGRRRIGKTFLVRELFEDKFAFRATGRDNVTTRQQLENFSQALKRYSGKDSTAGDWNQAFALLGEYIENMPETGPKLLFLDELPWFDTRGSKFVSALEHFWNDWASYRRDIKLIVCGSATTWMLDEIIHSRGGLHNRVTHSIQLEPFTLHETERYFAAHGFPYERPELLECYMAVGGVAYYLTLFDRSESVAQNIDRLCFSRGGEMVGEFENSFKSLFKKAHDHIAVVTALQTKGMGMSRLELIEKTGLGNNGNMTRLLNELERCDFIRSYVPFGKSKKDKLYQLIDPFTLFYFRFMHGQTIYQQDYWLKLHTTPAYDNWCGYAFEIVCLNHLDQIMHALGIDGIISTPCSWTYRPRKAVLEDDLADEDLRHGAQIDLLIERADRTINICEMKYSHGKYEITKSYDSLVAHRMQTFRKVTKTNNTLVLLYITPEGLVDNVYSRRLARTVVGNDLFVGR